MMDKDEIIILSSDDDENDVRQFEKYKPYVTIKQIPKQPDKNIRPCLVDKVSHIAIKRKYSTSVNNNEEKLIKNNKVPKIKCKNANIENPEVVDLVECVPNDFNKISSDCGRNKETEQVQSHLKLDVIDIDGVENDPKYSFDETVSNTVEREASKLQESHMLNVEANEVNVTSDAEGNINKPEKTSTKADSEIHENSFKQDDMTKENSDQNLTPFTEFVELCGSLESIPKDRIRLTKKLMKRYGEAKSDYIKSEEFRLLIEKCKEKVNKNNLYLIAKDITAELSFRKKINVTPEKTSQPDENSQRISESAKKIEPISEKENKQTRKRTKFINKILKKLDKLGSKIRELEEEEVDLSDEEGSAYVQLQRYRDRFCQIYKKLCTYTNEIPHADRVYNRKICFTESKYPAINKCIEVFLNKTKRFPDFTDIMKLLESQSSSLGLPSNRESLRTITIEIFQQVGAMLQRRRKYDLWDSFCGFLNDEVDPANDDPVLEKILRDNYETRIKKEQEIFQHYTELQEKGRLEPEEVPEEEANRSPVESGNEDEQEIEEIENDINKRLDVAITEDTKDKENCSSDWGEDKTDPTNETSPMQKETKNNYKNCKSLKWRSENSGKSKDESLSRESCCSEDSSTDQESEEKEAQKPSESVDEENSSDSKENNVNSEESGKNDSDVDLFSADTERGNSLEKTTGDDETETVKETPVGEEKLKPNGYDSFQSDDENNCLGKSIDSFDVHYCHVFADNVFENFSGKKKHGEKRKVFRDLTNVNRLMELHGKGRAMSGLFAPSFFHRSFCELEKTAWKKRFRMSFRLGGFREQKGALGREGKTGKSMNSNTGGESDERRVQNNSESGGNDRGGFYSGHGGESHEDGDEDRNRKNGRTGDDLSDNKPEEEDDEDEKDENEAESTEHSQEIDKTEESQETQLEIEWSSDVSMIKHTKENLQVVSDNHKENEEQTGKKNTENKIFEDINESSFLKHKTETEILEKPEKIISTDQTKIVESKRETVILKCGQNTELKKNRDNEILVKRNEEIIIAEKPETIINSDKTEIIENRRETVIIKGGPNTEIKKNKENEILEKRNEEILIAEKNEEVEIIERHEESKATEEFSLSEKGEKETLEKDKTEVIKKPNEETSKLEARVVFSDKNEKSTEKRTVGLTENDEPNIIGSVMSKRPPKRLSQEMSPFKKEIATNRVSGEAESQYKVCKVKTENWSVSLKKAQELFRADTTERSLQNDQSSPKCQRKNAQTSDEEIVKRFLLHSPSSISITPPRRLSLSKPPSQAAMQALATLRNLKGISATIVRGKPKSEENVKAMGGPNKRNSDQRNFLSPPKRCRNKLPVISSVQSIYHSTPKIVTVQGNVSGFENASQESTNSSRPESDSSSIRISNVWGSLPNNFMQPMTQNNEVTPGCSSYGYQQTSFNSQQSNYQSTQGVRKKNRKKKVEYVVLE